jgi:O-antigen/teichoic acid export membrane protein
MSTTDATDTTSVGNPSAPERAPLRRSGSTFAREGTISATWGLGVYALSLVTGPLLARSLGPAGRGDLAAVVAPAQVLVFVLGLGVPAACAYFTHSVPRAALVGAAVATSALVALPVVVVLWPLIPTYLEGHDPATVLALRVLLLQTLVTIVALAAIEMRRARSAGMAYNVLRSLPVLLNAAAIVTLFVLGQLDLDTALLAVVGAVIVADLVALVVARLPRPVWRWEVLRRSWSFGARAWVGTVSNAMAGRLDQVLLVSLVAPAELGRYAVAVSAANVTIPIGQGAASAVLPQLRRGGLRTGRDVARAAVTVGVAAGCVALAVGLAAPWVLPLLFGEAFRGAVEPLLILLPGQVAGAVAEVLRADLGARGHPGLASLCQGVAAAVTVVLLVPAVHAAGISGAALVTTVAYLSMAVVAALLVRRQHTADREASDAT